jgi:hypothetical protein
MPDSPQNGWPSWWEWELELSSHVLKRMVDRGFNETDLRLMMSTATGFHEDHQPERWVIETLHESRNWEIIVEPDSIDQLLIVITAYPVELR